MDLRGTLFRSLSPATLGAVQAAAVARRFAAGELLLRGGTHAEWLHVVVVGLVREFYVTAAGDEHTRVFVAEGGVTGSLLDLVSGTAAVTWIEALEATRTISIRFREFNELAARFPDLQSLARTHAERLAVRKTLREYEMLALSAGERLAQWKLEHAAIDGRIRRKLLASYLGISPVHLSRLTAAEARAGHPEKGERRH
jgi:CRP-like cAMP-binding protein